MADIKWNKKKFLRNVWLIWLICTVILFLSWCDAPVVKADAVPERDEHADLLQVKQHFWENKPYYEVLAEVTAYTVSIAECGKLDGITASGVKVQPGMLAGPKEISFGTKVRIAGSDYTVTDRGGAIKITNGVYKFDIYMESLKDALRWGRQRLIVRIYY